MADLKDLTQLIAADNVTDLNLTLDQHPDLGNIKTDQGISLLQLAIYYRKPEIVKALRSRRTDLNIHEYASLGDIGGVSNALESNPELINSFAADGFTALGLACFFGHLEVARYLISVGADVNIPSNNSFKVAPIHSSCAISSFEITELLLKHHANVDAKQQQGVTPLHETAHHGNFEMTKLLIKYGADLDAKTDLGKTPYDMAMEKGDQRLADLLRS